jgi:hypothetical protein
MGCHVITAHKLKHILPKLKTAVGLIKGHTTLRAHKFKLGHTQQQDCQLHRDKKRRQRTQRMLLSGSGKQKIQNTGLYIPEDQGSRKHEGE